MKEYQIRYAEKKDLNDLVDLCELHAIFERSDYDKTNKKELLNKHLFSDTPSLYALVVDMDDKLIGYASFMKQFSTWDAAPYIYMDCLFLKEGTRSLGIGAELMEKIKEESRNMGCDLIQWQTPDFNTRAIKFYKRIGGISKAKERFFLDPSS